MKRRAHPHEHEAELNIIPYLDIMVNLVMFMLLSMTGFITFQVINVNMPDLANGPTAIKSTPPPRADSKQLKELNVSISARGFYIAAQGGVLPGITADPNAPKDPKSAPPTIPCKDPATMQSPCKPARYDYDALTMEMMRIKKQYPQTTQFFLAADQEVAYETVVKTMDATRGTAKEPLFQDVAFAAMQ